MSERTSGDKPGTPAHLVVGATVDQMDALNRLVQMIAAHGDAVAATNPADTARLTLPTLGQAIFDSAVAARRILDRMEAQPLGQEHRHGGASEGRGAYVVAGDRTMRRPSGAGLGRDPWGLRIPSGARNIRRQRSGFFPNPALHEGRLNDTVGPGDRVGSGR